MARVPLIDGEADPALAAFVEKVKGRRRGKLINVYRTLLNSPPLAESWYGHINAVRWDTTLTGRLREILIIRIGHLNGSAYVLRQHVPHLAEPEGLNEADCAALSDWQPSEFFDAAERAALAFCDAMTRNIAVPDDVFDALADHFGDREIVEIAVLVGTYNMHTRVMAALDVDLEESS